MAKKTVINSKKTVIDRRVDVELSDMLGDQSIEMTIDYLQRMKEIYVKDYHIDAKFEMQPYGYDGGFDIYLILYREETDSEYQDRLEKEKIAQEKKEQARLRELERTHAKKQRNLDLERAEYERLKAKYEPNSSISS